MLELLIFIGNLLSFFEIRPFDPTSDLTAGLVPMVQFRNRAGHVYSPFVPDGTIFIAFLIVIRTDDLFSKITLKLIPRYIKTMITNSPGT
jgi:hypothetical protein